MEKIFYYLKKVQKSSEPILKKYAERINNKKVIISKLPGSKKVQPVISRHRLVFGVGSAIAVSLLLTVFSVLLYVITGTSKLDLSRPGYEGVRKQVVRSSLDEDSFAPGGALNNKVIDDYLEKYKKQSQRLNKYDSYNPKLLDDAPLGLSSTVTGPSDGAPNP